MEQDEAGEKDFMTIEDDFRKSFMILLSRYRRKGMSLEQMDNLICIIESSFAIKFKQESTKVRKCPQCGDNVRGLECKNCGYSFQSRLKDFLKVK